MRTEEEIYALIDKASSAVSEGIQRFPGMSYEEGVVAALRWALEDYDESPLA